MGTLACAGCGTLATGRRRRGLCNECTGLLLAAGERAHLGTRTVPGRRFVAYVDMAGPDPGTDAVQGPCWLWTGAITDQGYGLFRLGPDQLVGAHVFAYTQAHGPVPDGFLVDHRCHQRDDCPAPGVMCPHRQCVNPAHLRVTTNQQNTLEGAGPAALNAMKTHCDGEHGPHELSGDNIYRHPQRGTRHCRACQRIRSREAVAAARVATAAAQRAMAGQDVLPGLFVLPG